MTEPTPNPERLGRPAVTVTTWNILADAYTPASRYPDTRPGDLDWNHRQARIVDTVTRWTSNIIGLQETTADTAELLDDHHTNTRPGHTVMWTPKTCGRPDGLITITDTRPAGITVIEHDDPSGTVTAVITLPDTTNPDADVRAAARPELVIVNTHLRWAAPDTPTHAHIGVTQAAEILTHLDQLDTNIPIIVLGDSNDLPGGPVRSLFTEAGFHDPVTDPTAIVEADRTRGGRAVSIDIIASRNAPITTTDVDQLTRPAPGPDMASDHAAVHATMTLPTRT